MRSIEAFKSTESLPFKLKDEKERIVQIEQSIMSIERNLKAHLNTFEKPKNDNNNMTNNVSLSEQTKLSGHYQNIS